MRFSDKQQMYLKNAAYFLSNLVQLFHSVLEADPHQLRQNKVYDKTNDPRLKQIYHDTDTSLDSQTPDIKL